MFFMRLRRGAKWAFIVLIFVFAFTFLFAGVGGGGGGSNVIQELLGMRGSGDAVKSAEKAVKNNPHDTSALQRLAQAYIAKQRRGDAINTYKQYLRLKPNDLSVLPQLANLQQELAVLRWYRYSNLQSELTVVYGPLSTDPLQTIAGTDTLLSNYSNSLSTKLSEAYASYVGAAKAWEDTFKRYAKAVPMSNTLQRANVEYQLAQAAYNAGDYSVAIKSYKTFLKLTPKSPLAAEAKKALAELQKASSSR
jgi:tetratricopeptide (TPR) repeat protein